MKNDVMLNFMGESFGTISGPDIFEIIPFLLLDNMLKYCPTGGSVDIGVSEEADTIVVRMSGMGPAIEADELDRVFELGFRGKNAIRSGASGSGMGLFMARRLTEEGFGGTISVTQGQGITTINRIPYREIVFDLTFPKSK